jgi:hypothetical protein
MTHNLGTVNWMSIKPADHCFLIGILEGQRPVGSTRQCGHQWPIVPAPGDYDDGEIGGMIGKGNRSTLRKPAPVPLCPPQTPHAALTGTRAATVGSQRLTAWCTARPPIPVTLTIFCSKLKLLTVPNVFKYVQSRVLSRCDVRVWYGCNWVQWDPHQLFPNTTAPAVETAYWDSRWRRGDLCPSSLRATGRTSWACPLYVTSLAAVSYIMKCGMINKQYEAQISIA